MESQDRGAPAAVPAAPTHVAIPLPLAGRLVAYLKDPKFDFDTAAQLVAGIMTSPALPIEVVPARVAELEAAQSSG